MWWLSVIVVSAAFEIDVDVIVEEAAPSTVAVPRPDVVPVPVGRGVLRIDGSLDEVAWIDTPLAPPLGPWMSGAAPPTVRAAVVRTGGGIAFGVWDVPTDIGVTLVFDPDGTARRWWRIELGDRIRTRLCSLEGVKVPDEAVVPMPAVPCVSRGDVQVAGGAGMWEVHLPADVMGRLTTSARLLMTAGSPSGAGGTWAPYGRADLVPAVGLPLGLGTRPGRLTVELQDSGDWDVVVHLREDDSVGVWEIRRFVHGVEVDVIRPTLTQRGANPVGLPALDAAVVVVEASVAAKDGLWHSVVRQIRHVMPEAWLRTPVVDDVVELGWRSPRPVVRTLELRTLTGKVVAQQQVELPRGGGRVVIPVSWRKKDLVIVWDGLMAPARLVAKR